MLKCTSCILKSESLSPSSPYFSRQIVDASAALKKLRAEWSTYAVIDAEGRAGNIDAARKILGGVAPHVHVSAPPSRAPCAAAGSGSATTPSLPGATPPADPNPLFDALELPLPEIMEMMQRGYLESHAKAVERAASCEHSAWLGGSRLASEAASPQRWLTAREYEAEGPAGVHAKCW